MADPNDPLSQFGGGGSGGNTVPNLYYVQGYPGGVSWQTLQTLSASLLINSGYMIGYFTAPDGSQGYGWAPTGWFNASSSNSGFDQNPFGRFGDPLYAPPWQTRFPPQSPSGGGFGGSVTQSYIDIAKTYGEPLTSAEALHLFNLGVTPQEWATRLEGDRWLNENKDQFPGFEATLVARGLLKEGGHVDPYEFLKKASPMSYYHVWQEFAGRAATSLAGGTVGGIDPNLDFTRDEINALNALLPGTQDLASLIPIYQQAAGLGLEHGAWSRWKGYGLVRGDFLNLAAGIADAPTIEKMNRVIGEDQLFAAYRPQLSLAGSSGQSGLLG